MKLLLFGGTFDPPHIGHMNNLRAAMAVVQPDRAIVMPAGIPPHKQAGSTPAALRLAMCACFRALGPAVAVSGWEMRQEGRSYTVHTLRMLRQNWPGAGLYLSVGSDMLLSFEEWYCWQEILDLATLVVQSRQNGDAAALGAYAQKLAAHGGRVLFAGADTVECASSDIRAGHYGAEQLARLLPAPVPAIIRHCGLYGGCAANDL